MVNILDRIYTIEDKYNLLRKLRVYSLIRFTTRIAANILIPVYFRISNIFIRNCITINHNREYKIIVSLTSFPQRINRSWIVIESIIRQKYKPDRIIIWLSLNQFNNLKNLPKSLLKLQKRGLEIRLCEDDLRSHKKYYYAIQEYPKDIIITIDDDVIYNTNLIQELVSTYKRYPNSVICNHATEILFRDNYIAPYKEWVSVKSATNNTFKIMPVGVGGVLYPPNSLHSDVLNFKVFKKKCFYADDIWLNSMARLNKTKSVKTKFFSNYLPIINFNNVSLYSENVTNNKNDEQINLLIDHYRSVKNINLFNELIK